jgi:hypothetical protein
MLPIYSLPDASLHLQWDHPHFVLSPLGVCVDIYLAHPGELGLPSERGSAIEESISCCIFFKNNFHK